MTSKLNFLIALVALSSLALMTGAAPASGPKEDALCDILNFEASLHKGTLESAQMSVQRCKALKSCLYEKCSLYFYEANRDPYHFLYEEHLIEVFECAQEVFKPDFTLVNLPDEQLPYHVFLYFMPNQALSELTEAQLYHQLLLPPLDESSPFYKVVQELDRLYWEDKKKPAKLEPKSATGMIHYPLGGLPTEMGAKCYTRYLPEASSKYHEDKLEPMLEELLYCRKFMVCLRKHQVYILEHDLWNENDDYKRVPTIEFWRLYTCVQDTFTEDNPVNAVRAEQQARGEIEDPQNAPKAGWFWHFLYLLNWFD